MMAIIRHAERSVLRLSARHASYQLHKKMLHTEGRIKCTRRIRSHRVRTKEGGKKSYLKSQKGWETAEKPSILAQTALAYNFVSVVGPLKGQGRIYQWSAYPWFRGWRIENWDAWKRLLAARAGGYGRGEAACFRSFVYAKLIGSKLIYIGLPRLFALPEAMLEPGAAACNSNSAALILKVGVIFCAGFGLPQRRTGCVGHDEPLYDDAESQSIT